VAPSTGGDRLPAELPAGYVELYKLAVEMADRISARRGVANSFFLTINTGLLPSWEVRSSGGTSLPPGSSCA